MHVDKHFHAVFSLGTWRCEDLKLALAVRKPSGSSRNMSTPFGASKAGRVGSFGTEMGRVSFATRRGIPFGLTRVCNI